MAYLTLAVPLPLVPVARQVALAFEPDMQPDPTLYDAFALEASDEQGTLYGVYGAPVADWLAESAVMWKAAPDQLLEAVDRGLARYPGYPVPSGYDVGDFALQVQLSTVYGVAAGMADLGLAPVATE